MSISPVPIYFSIYFSFPSFPHFSIPISPFLDLHFFILAPFLELRLLPQLHSHCPLITLPQAWKIWSACEGLKTPKKQRWTQPPRKRQRDPSTSALRPKTKKKREKQEPAPGAVSAHAVSVVIRRQSRTAVAGPTRVSEVQAQCDVVFGRVPPIAIALTTTARGVPAAHGGPSSASPNAGNKTRWEWTPGVLGQPSEFSDCLFRV